MGLDIATILATLGTVFGGNPLAVEPGFSIGGVAPTGNLLGNLLGLLGTPQGLDGTHNTVESDSSITRDDLYVTGDAATMNITKFIEWYDMFENSGLSGMDLMYSRANTRFQETVATNPNFYFGPFTGMIARNAGYLFAGRFFANYSSENPTGVLCEYLTENG